MTLIIESKKLLVTPSDHAWSLEKGEAYQKLYEEELSLANKNLNETVKKYIFDTAQQNNVLLTKTLFSNEHDFKAHISDIDGDLKLEADLDALTAQIKALVPELSGIIDNTAAEMLIKGAVTTTQNASNEDMPFIDMPPFFERAVYYKDNGDWKGVYDTADTLFNFLRSRGLEKSEDFHLALRLLAESSAGQHDHSKAVIYISSYIKAEIEYGISLQKIAEDLKWAYGILGDIEDQAVWEKFLGTIEEVIAATDETSEEETTTEDDPLAEDAKFSEAHSLKGIVLARLKRYSEAREVFEKIVSSNAMDGEAFLQLKWAAFEGLAGIPDISYEEKVGFLEMAVATASKIADSKLAIDSNVHLAGSYEMNGNFEKACHAYMAAAAISESSSELEDAIILYSAAWSAIEKVESVSSELLEALLKKITDILTGGNNIKELEGLKLKAESVIAKDPSIAYPYFAVGVALYLLKEDADRAKKNFESFTEIGSGSDTPDHFTLGTAFYHLYLLAGDNDAKKIALEKAAEHYMASDKLYMVVQFDEMVEELIALGGCEQAMKIAETRITLAESTDGENRENAVSKARIDHAFVCKKCGKSEGLFEIFLARLGYLVTVRDPDIQEFLDVSMEMVSLLKDETNKTNWERFLAFIDAVIAEGPVSAYPYFVRAYILARGLDKSAEAFVAYNDFIELEMMKNGEDEEGNAGNKMNYLLLGHACLNAALRSISIAEEKVKYLQKAVEMYQKDGQTDTGEFKQAKYIKLAEEKIAAMKQKAPKKP